MNADVHLIAYKQRITPVVRGKVTQVSADRLTEKRTDTPYYVALVRTLGEVAWVAPFAIGGACRRRTRDRNAGQGGVYYRSHITS